MQIHHLACQGVSKAWIAQRFGVSRQTVYNHLSPEAPAKPHVSKSAKLDPFQGYIQARLERFDLKATVLFGELRKLGYTGGLTILREKIRPIKTTWMRRVTERFETLPGQQAQLDWGECGHIQVEGETKKLYVFVLVLGYSRMMYARFTTSCRLGVLLSCLRAALETLGVPQEVLVDNMKQAVDQHDVVTGAVRWNPAFLDFARHYSFLPVACPPYWPRVKGKVERGVGYVKTSFLEGCACTDVDDLNRQLGGWLDTVANVRLHGTTAARPIDRHRQELAVLRPAGAVPAYDTRPILFRKVPSDSHITYEGVRYSVDPTALDHTVLLRPEGERVGALFSVYLGDRVVARHQRQRKGSRPVTLEEHAQAIRRISRGTPERRGKGKRPHFLQVESLSPSGFPNPLCDLTPQVEVRSLKAYEVLLEEGVR